MIRKELSVLGFPGYEVTDTGKVWNVTKEKWLTEYVNRGGYRRVCMFSSRTNDYCLVAVHRLVAMAFIPKPKGKDVVNHIDCDTSNNSVSNLEWVTTTENLQHQLAVGSISTLLNEKDVHFICRCLEEGMGCTEISRNFGYSSDSIYQIKRGDNWKEIACKYNFNKPKKYNSKLTEDQVIEICNKLNEGYDSSQVARLLGFSYDVVNKIRTRKNWTKITDIHLKV